MTKKKKGTAGGDAAGGASTSQQRQPLAGGASLIICRNKHWRYISSFHGPWLQLPPEILDSLAHQNYYMPAPRLIDPSVFYDVVKIRKHVDEAAQDSVRATTGLSNVAMNGRMDYFGAGGGPGSQLSKERIFKIRQKAVRLLSRAFELDEVAASVATMQATSTVEDVGAHVLRREPANTDAKYVNFFHEKIPSRAMEHHTPLEPLSEILAALPMEQQPAPLRTRALVQIFKQQWDGAALDLTAALRIVEEFKRIHKPNQQGLELASRMRREQEEWARGFKDWRSVPTLKEEDQPRSLEMQLLFNRAGVYLTIACNSVHAALDGLKQHQVRCENGEEMNGVHTKAHTARLEARKRVKLSAKKALKDYVSFLSNLDYTPGLPYEITNEIMRRVYDLANGNRTPTTLSQRPRLIELNADGDEISESSDSSTSVTTNNSLTRYEKPRQQADPFERDENGWPRFPTPKIHPASTLFSERPPHDLPPFPTDETKLGEVLRNETLNEAFGSREAVTYHPLLTDALHSVLLAHALLQTSPAEIKRHAHNAARLTRIADGYPIFQSARSPARADWIEVLRRANNWLGLSAPWQTLCKSTPLPDAAGGWAKAGSGAGSDGASVAGGRENKLEVMKRRKEMGTETAEQKRERIKQESIIDALSDDRVVDEESFQKAVRARERRALEDEEGLSGPLKDKDVAPPSLLSAEEDGPQPVQNGQHHSPASASDDQSNSTSPTSVSGHTTPSPHTHASKPALQQDREVPKLKRWAQDEYGKEYPISTERAEAIARWIKEAPLSMVGPGMKKKKKKSSGPGRSKAAATGDTDHANGNGTAGGTVGLTVTDEGPD
ncbi:hypothetical protein K431DRAFT_311562 [Polychaeton citri CBS 116435]|uniref:Histidine kinase group protein n=1 Tax=Polychaeton citri CBS 116435 TaxID=1314669 RepID=A0A9P4QCS7_9PEZI|nr:hypothetical protein K431DRAFT_311562 [Polychaeton citri CBS 116435]